MKDLRILVVEDELIIAESHKDKLLSFGVGEVAIASTVPAAHALLQSFGPNLVLLDVRLEEHFEGIDLGEHISAHYRIPFIYLTAHSDLETIKKMITTWPLGYISKPVRKPELFATLNLALNQIRLTRQSVAELQDGTTLIRFRKEELKFAQSQGNYVSLHFKENDKRRLIRNTLENLVELLNDPRFFRVSRSYVINLELVEMLDKKQVTVSGLPISISRQNYDELVLRLEGFRG